MKFPDKIYFVSDDMGLDSAKQYEKPDQGGRMYSVYLHIDVVGKKIKEAVGAALEGRINNYT